MTLLYPARATATHVDPCTGAHGATSHWTCVAAVPPGHASSPGARGTGGNGSLPAGRPGLISLPARPLIRHHEGYRTPPSLSGPSWPPLGYDPARLWSYYLQLVRIEEAFHNLKGDLAVRPIFHQLEGRVEAHIFIAFLAYCLHVTLARRLGAFAPGLTPLFPVGLPWV